MRTCSNCDYYDKQTKRCGRWQCKVQKPETACTSHRIKSAVISVKTIKEPKYITY